MSETFLSYRRYRWFWINCALLIALVAAYILDNPVGGRSGSSWLGWAYGFMAAGGISYLMWYGVRKRSYRAHRSTLRGCLSAHAWIGLMLTFLVPLHCAFSFGFNVHSLAYALMVIVIVSGLYGALNYVWLAPVIEAHRGGGTNKKVLEQIAQLSRDIEGAQSKHSDEFLRLRMYADFAMKPGVWVCFRRRLVPPAEASQEAKLLAALPESEQEAGLKLLGLTHKKRELALQLQQDVAALTKIRLWLFLHLPVSLALVVCLLIHIFVVFWYR